MRAVRCRALHGSQRKTAMVQAPAACCSELWILVESFECASGFLVIAPPDGHLARGPEELPGHVAPVQRQQRAEQQVRLPPAPQPSVLLLTRDAFMSVRDCT